MACTKQKQATRGSTGSRRQGGRRQQGAQGARPGDLTRPSCRRRTRASWVWASWGPPRSSTAWAHSRTVAGCTAAPQSVYRVHPQHGATQHASPTPRGTQQHGRPPGAKRDRRDDTISRAGPTTRMAPTLDGTAPPPPDATGFAILTCLRPGSFASMRACTSDILRDPSAVEFISECESCCCPGPGTSPWRDRGACMRGEKAGRRVASQQGAMGTQQRSHDVSRWPTR